MPDIKGGVIVYFQFVKSFLLIMPEIRYRDSISSFEGVIQTVSIIWYLFYLNLTFQ